MDRRIVTVFGGSGFVGRYIVKRLAEKGYTVRVPSRNVERAKFLKPMGYLGQVVPVHCDVTDAASVKDMVEGSHAVINLIGILYEKGARSFKALHVDASTTIAQACKDSGVETYLHMSALGADKDSESIYASSKGFAEQAVREILPEAVIFRPSVIFGPEDGFLNLFAYMVRVSPVVPVVGAPWPVFDTKTMKLDLYGNGGPRFQPVYVGDVADAFMVGLEEAETRGKTFDLGGPKTYSFKEILDFLKETTRQSALLLPLPIGLAKIKASILQLLPVPPLTTDQVELLKTDNVVEEGAQGFAALGLTPNAMEATAPSYLKRHRPPRNSGEFKRFA